LPNPPHAFPEERERNEAGVTPFEAAPEGILQSLVPALSLLPHVEPDSKAKILWDVLVDAWRAGSRDRVVKSTVFNPSEGSKDGDCITESMFKVGSNPSPNYRNRRTDVV
jgi:hypothetical protein